MFILNIPLTHLVHSWFGFTLLHLFTEWISDLNIQSDTEEDMFFFTLVPQFVVGWYISFIVCKIVTGRIMLIVEKVKMVNGVKE